VPFATTPAGWQEHTVEPSGIALSLPPKWLAFDEADLADPAVQAMLAADFVGARGLFTAIAAQGARVRLVFLGVDPAGRGAPTMPATVAVVAIEPRIPAVGLEIGANLVVRGLELGLDVETDVTRERIKTPVGEAVRIAFDHRVASATGPRGVRVALDGALVSTDRASFLVLRNVDAATDEASALSLDAVLGTLRELP